MFDHLCNVRNKQYLCYIGQLNGVFKAPQLVMEMQLWYKNVYVDLGIPDRKSGANFIMPEFTVVETIIQTRRANRD